MHLSNLRIAPRIASRIAPAALLAATLFLPGCAALKMLQGEPDRDVFELRTPPAGGADCGRSRVAELVIELPKTRGTLDSERIMIRPSALQTQYLPDAVWGDTVPVTLQRLLVDSLGRTNAFTHVGRAPLGTAGDYAVISEIRDFNAEVAGKGAIVRLAVDAQMVREMDASVVTRGSSRPRPNRPRPGPRIPAFDAASQQLVAQMTEWGLRGVGINPASCR
ncbi:ABC-type transport auxiliary lipoprotein family protein [Paracoccus sp. DMF-8]|uniref:ABC-type transport auxiliary lipoprotein family protein n=1 Tax=Paracoccus sp. DMF-8 TaxID=3019445 RepID=UPI0023E39655|nr:ABC-type transport auxiliary lipoprotein family protein [Paracoccus sp. DMF-8]MDF3607656.1 ABC-type transport auxiliary lipoprotein family protein [Paracoccus sp. DMF-8]